MRVSLLSLDSTPGDLDLRSSQEDPDLRLRRFHRSPRHRLSAASPHSQPMLVPPSSTAGETASIPLPRLLPPLVCSPAVSYRDFWFLPAKWVQVSALRSAPRPGPSPDLRSPAPRLLRRRRCHRPGSHLSSSSLTPASPWRSWDSSSPPCAAPSASSLTAPSASDCEYTFNALLDELQTDQWPVETGNRARRCTGVALGVAAGLLGACMPGTGSRIIPLVGRPCTEGPGMVVSKDLSEQVRSHKDIDKDAAPHFHKAAKFYDNLAKQLVNQGHVLDLFASVLDQVGVAEMKVAVQRTGGLVVLAESWDIKIQGVIGPCTSKLEINGALMNLLQSDAMPASAQHPGGLPRPDGRIRWLPFPMPSWLSSHGSSSCSDLTAGATGVSLP